MPSVHVPGVISSHVPNGPNKIFLGGLPPYLNEEQIVELLQAFGTLKGLHVVKDNATNMGKVRCGFVVCARAFERLALCHDTTNATAATFFPCVLPLFSSPLSPL